MIMSDSMRHFSLYVVLLLSLLPLNVWSLEDPSKIEAQLKIDEKLGDSIDLDGNYLDSDGTRLKFRDLFITNRPLILVPGYYHCPRLCGLVFHGVLEVLNQLSLKLGQDFQIVSVSFDEMDTPESALSKLQEMQAGMVPQQKVDGGWRFLTTDKVTGSRLMQQIGYKYFKDGEEFAHGAVIVVLTPDGKVSRYLYGIKFSPFDTKMALVEAGKGLIGSTMDHIMMFCFRFDSTKGKYVWAAFNVMRVGALVTLFALGSLLFVLWRKKI